MKAAAGARLRIGDLVRQATTALTALTDQDLKTVRLQLELIRQTARDLELDVLAMERASTRSR